MKGTVRRGIPLYSLLALSFIVFTSTDIYLPFAPKLAHEFGALERWLKGTFMLTPLLSLGVSYPTAWLSQRLGPYQTLVVYTTVFALGSLCCFASPGLSYFMLGRLMQALAVGGLSVVNMVILTELAQGERLAATLSVYASLFPLAFLSAPFLGYAMEAAGGWRSVYLGLAATSGFLALALWTLKAAAAAPGAKRSRLPTAPLAPGRENAPSPRSCSSPRRQRRRWESPSTRHGLTNTPLKTIPRLTLLSPTAVASVLPSALSFLFITSAPFLFIERYHLSSGAYTLLQALPPCSNLFGSFLYRHFLRRYGLNRAWQFGRRCAGTLLALLTAATIGVIPITWNPYTLTCLFCLFQLGSPFVSASGAALYLQGADGFVAAAKSANLSFSRNVLILGALVVASFALQVEARGLVVGMGLVAMACVLLMRCEQRVTNAEHAGAH